MADMLVELKGNPDEAKSEDGESKDLPMETVEPTDEAEDKTSAKNLELADEEVQEKDRSEEQKSTLRKTLERMLGGK